MNVPVRRVAGPVLRAAALCGLLLAGAAAASDRPLQALKHFLLRHLELRHRLLDLLLAHLLERFLKLAQGFLHLRRGHLIEQLLQFGQFLQNLLRHQAVLLHLDLSPVQWHPRQVGRNGSFDSLADRNVEGLSFSHRHPCGGGLLHNDPGFPPGVVLLFLDLKLQVFPSCHELRLFH